MKLVKTAAPQSQDTGVIESIKSTTDGAGRQVLRFTVDFYGVDAPDFGHDVVFERKPVKIVPAYQEEQAV